MEKPLSPEAAAVLARFPGPVKLSATKVRRGFALGLGVMGAAICIGGFALGHQEGKPDFHVLMGLVAIPFALFAIWAGASLANNRLSLELDGMGFTRDGGARTRWTDVREFWFYETFQAGAYVGFDRNSTNNKFFPEMVPFDQRFNETYGFRADELAALLNRWRDRAITS